LGVYGEGTTQTPRYRLWNGTAWGTEGSAQSVGGIIQWIVVEGGTQRDEYVVGVQDASNDINVQIYSATSSTWRNLQEVTTTVSDNTARGFDIAYERTSGDAIVAYCDGDADPAYYVWNGSTWTSGGAINLSSANACEWIQLASDPISDEIILVSRDTGAQYEAQVWNGSSWGNAQTLGSMTDVLHEGIAVEYEESGNQAVVAVSNAGNANFAWIAWDGIEWTVPTTQTLGDDFEWGVMKRDVGSDNMALCYVDQDDDIGIVRWDGIGWNTNQELDAASNIGASGLADGRSVTCEFETTAGRDGYIMVPYSDTAAARYRYWSGTTSPAEVSISTIQDSWTAQSVRAGDGTIVTLFHDDTNGRYDSSYWNGSAWGAIATIETSQAVTAEPFRAPLGMAPKVFQDSTGVMTTPIIEFDNVPGQPTWGEVLWTTTEPAGTDIALQVLYESGGVCTSLVPDIDLPGNSIGFDATTSPVNLSTLSTTTYDGLCLRASFDTQNASSPTLDEWSLSWERQPYLSQAHFRWYVNTNALTPTDAWPAGATDLIEDATIPSDNAPILNDVLRLRMSLLVENVSLSTSALTMKLQYSDGSDCSAIADWYDVGAIGSTTAKWRGYNNASPSDGATLPSNVLAGSDVSASYEEENDTAPNPNSATANQEVEWDFVLQHNATNATTYCFRAIDANGEVLNEYSSYPSLRTNGAPAAPTLEKLFDNEATASTTPWFEFVAEDPDGDDITYQVQVDDDAAFGSPDVDRNSQTNLSEFTNIITPSDKDAFTSGQMIRFIPSSSFTSGTTYYWRTRAKDRNDSNEWSAWSGTFSFTVDSGVTITTWRQTTEEQFDTGLLEDTETSASDDVALVGGFTNGTTTSHEIDFDDASTGNAWGSLSWNDNETTGDIKYHIEYWDGAEWELIPDGDLSGNAAGYDTSSISLLGLSPSVYDLIRLRADFTNSGGTPRLLDWQVQWGFAVEQPDQTALFDNEKAGTTTPTFRFLSSDPQSDDLIYEISIGTSPLFTSSTTRASDAHSGFANTASSSDTSPFTHNNSISFQVQQADALTNGNTYWWRVRARDPLGGNAWSVWSPTRSFTIDTSVTVSTWFQTSDDQFTTDSLNDVEVNGSGGARITSIIREAFMAYAEGTVQAPRFRIWNGSSWGTEQSGVSIGAAIRFVETAAAPTRDEYAIATMGSSGVIDVQIYNGSTDTSGNRAEISAAVSDITQRGFDVAYETSSGDAIAVACTGTEAVYRVWNGSAWSATSSLALSVSSNCEWIKLATDPTSDEIILIARDATTGATDYEAMVWSGSSWGNATTMGSQVTANNEGIAIEYEESGGQAIAVVSNGAGNNFLWRAWNGSAWSATSTVATGNDFANGRITRDLGSDNMALCYIDIDADIGYTRWNGSSWGATAEFEATGNSQNGRPVSCEFETTAGRDGYLMIPYSDTIQAEYVSHDGSILSGITILNTITDSWEVRTVRTGDDNILAIFYDDANTEYDFSYWNGTSFSTEQVLETTSIPTTAPATIPLDIVARRYPSFNSGIVLATPVVFSDGLGPKWGSLFFSDSTPGSSDIRYQIEYFTSTSSWAVIPDTDLPGNVAGTSTSPFDISGINRTTYSTIRPRANLTCVGGTCPTLNDWALTWSEGIAVSGTAQAYDQSTNLTSGTVHVAVNGVLQAGKTATISGGSWSIPNVTAFTDDIVTVFIDGAGDSGEAVAVTKYDGDGDVTGMTLYERHVTLGSNDNPTVTNANLAQYDNSISGDEDIFHEVDAGNDLAACYNSAQGCSDVEVFVKSGTTYRPDSTSSGNISTHDIEINGTLVADGNTITVSGSWDNNATFTPNTSTVVFSATSSSETIDSTGAASASFNAVTFGSGSGSATWSPQSALDINGTLTINFGTLSPGSQQLTLAGNLTIGASGIFARGSATTTFDGTGTSNWTDNTVAKQDLGTIAIDGTTKTILLGAGAKATNITIGADDTLSVDNNYALEVLGNWTNSNSFLAQNGTVTFSATTSGKTITPGNSGFYNLTFNGSGGNWAFTSSVSATNDFTITNGIVTLTSATTTVGGSFTNAATFMHNNGVVLMNSSGAKTLTASSSSFYDLTFNGTGSWSFTGAHATSSRHTTIQAGTVTLPSGAFAVGGSFTKSGGSFTHNSGTVKMTAATAQTLRLNNSDLFNLTFSGSGSWSFVDTNATTTNAVRFESGTATFPSGVFAVGGSWTNAGGTFTHNNGTVKFNSSDTGETIAPGGSWFYNLLFDSSSGGWTIAGSATSSNNTTLSHASSFTLSSGLSLAVQGAFSNQVGGATTTWTGSTLFLNSGTSYSANTKTTGGDTYGTLLVGANTDIKMWNSSANAYTVDSTGSLYSQDHAAVDGDLYIWGEYISTANEHWSYATDFDGTALGGSSRQVDVRVAANASLTHTAGTLSIVGAANASTTVANQGSGAFGLKVAGGTLNAQYYDITNTDSLGLWLTGAPTVSSLADGVFTLTAEGGTSITVESSAINQNPALQIQRVRFEESITAGSNVTATSSPTSYWWFRNHYGAFDGEAFDSDVGGDPGFIRWDDSGFTITVSGTVYADHGVAPIGNPPCDGSTQVVRVVVSGGSSYIGSCDAGTGEYSIPGVTFNGDPVITAYLDTNGGKRAATITKTPTADITGLNIYENALVVRHEDSSPLTISDINFFDSADDSDLFFSAATGSPHTLSLEPNTELFVWGGKTFAPGGNVTLQSGGSGDARDGRLHIGASATFTAAGTETHSIGGGFTAESAATFTPANSTVAFTATTSGKNILAMVPVTFYNLTFNNVGGWSLVSPATTTVQNDFLVTAGTLSGTSTVVVSSGDLTGNGTIAMTGGTFVLEGAGNIGGNSAWQFFNLTLGSGSSATSVKMGSGTTTISSILTLRTSQTFQAGSAPIVLAGSGTPFVESGTFTPESAHVYYTGSSATNIADTSYGALTLAPASAGTPTYTILGGLFTAADLTLGGANPVSLNANTNDPSMVLSGDFAIGTGSAFIASNIGVLSVAGSWLNDGVFTHSGGSIEFDSTDSGETIEAGASSFNAVVFDSATGGWTITEHATTSSSLAITTASNFTLSPNQALSVGGTFTNSVGGGATTWTNSVLALVSGTTFSMNTKSAGADAYGTLVIGANTDVRSWNSSATTTSVHSSASLYSQDHAAVDGDLYIWGEYAHTSGSDYWSYATDFDGTALGGSSRQVDVRIAPSSSLTFSGGILDIIGTSSATTTIANQGSGTFAFAVSGGTLNAQYYSVRNTDASGISFSGSPTITTLSDGDFELGVNGGTMITVAGSAIDANPLKVFMRNSFATSTGISSGSNVTATGSSGSSWKFNLHVGNYDGESFDTDPGGDPGFIRWDDSASQITIAGNVYSDEGTSVHSVCDGSTPVVRLRVAGTSAGFVSCDGAGAYSIPNVSYNPGDSFIVYLDTNGGARAANVSVDPITNIADMHLYENRVILRHEDTSPLTILDITIYDSDEDSDIAFDATDDATDTLVVPPATKLVVWDGKTFAPAGNVTVTGGSGNAFDGTLALRANAVFSAAGTQSHSIGGDFTLATGATFSSAQSTFTFTSTTTGRTITPLASSFYNIVFNGSGGNWAFSSGAISATNDFTITNGTITLASGTTTVGGSFVNNGTFMHNNGLLLLNSTATGKNIRGGGSSFYNLTASSTSGGWTFLDTNATTTNNFEISGGGVTLPAGVFAIGSSFTNQGTFTHSSGTVKFTATAGGKTIRAGTSSFHNFLANGIGGSWSFVDTNATTTNDLTITNGTV
ncbi:MAG: hypothetical protein WA021_01205, partial [Minisyncoccia bacterium]